MISKACDDSKDVLEKKKINLLPPVDIGVHSRCVPSPRCHCGPNGSETVRSGTFLEVSHPPRKAPRSSP